MIETQLQNWLKSIIWCIEWRVAPVKDKVFKWKSVTFSKNVIKNVIKSNNWDTNDLYLCCLFLPDLKILGHVGYNPANHDGNLARQGNKLNIK